MEIDFSPLHNRLAEIEKQAPQLMRLAANVAKADVIERTMSGADVEEQEFTDYKPRYLKKKEKAGLYRGVVDHHWTGGLYDSIGYTESGAGIEIFFSDAYVKIAQGLQNRWGRHWWGVNATTIAKVMNVENEALQKILNGETTYG